MVTSKSFADIVTCNLFLKARNELTAAQLQLIVFALAAVECFVAEEALKVQVYFVAHFRCRSFYRYHACISLTHGFDLLIYVFVSDFLTTFEPRCPYSLPERSPAW